MHEYQTLEDEEKKILRKMYRISVGGEPWPRTQWVGRICPGILKKSAHPSKKIKPSKAQFFLLVGQLSLVRGWPSRTHSSGATFFFCERDNIILEETKYMCFPFYERVPKQFENYIKDPLLPPGSVPGVFPDRRRSPPNHITLYTTRPNEEADIRD